MMFIVEPLLDTTLSASDEGETYFNNDHTTPTHYGPQATFVDKQKKNQSSPSGQARSTGMLGDGAIVAAAFI